MPSSPAFSLRKWYFDLVAEDGTTWIGYAGELRYGVARLRFSSSTFSNSQETKTSLRVMAPVISDSDLSWSSRPLDILLTNTSRSRSFERVLHRDEHGEVLWRCVIPLGDATVQHGNYTLRGSGYAEMLELTAPPWLLPLDSLQWGHFTSPCRSLAWIRWTGPSPMQIAILDGTEAAVRRIEDDRVLLEDGGSVTMHGRTLLRHERIGSSLKPLGPIRSFLPPRITEAEETKWRSRGILLQRGGETHEGWVIHERVTFAQA